MTGESGDKGCCTPGRGSEVGGSAPGAGLGASDLTQGTCNDPDAHLVRLPGGTFLMGSVDPAAHPLDGEGPPRAVPLDPFAIGHARVLRGGSHLCHDSYCFRYRTSARSSAPEDSGTGHVGFRIARDL